jgi:hypothetical protein
MKNRAIFLAAAAGLAVSMPVEAQTNNPSIDEARLRAAIAEAEQARDAAVEALRKADEAIAVLKRALPTPPASPPAPISATVFRAAEAKRDPVPRPNDMPACDAPGATGIGGYMARIGDSGRQKKESNFHTGEAGTNEGINAFVYHCLGLTRTTDYENTTNLSAQFTATKGNDQIEAAITRTARALRLAPGGDLVAVYNRYSIGGFGRTGSNGDASLIDLTTSNFASGVGIVAGFEWGRMKPRPSEKVQLDIRTGVARARLECIAEKGVVDPLTAKDAVLGDRPRMSADPIASCEGNELVKWMSEPKHANKYWNDMIAPLWGYKGTPQRFAGVEIRYAFQDLSYRQVIDPKTGAVVAPTLPPALKVRPEPYSVKLYGGANRTLKYLGREEGTVGATASLTYRREIDFIGGTAGKTVCVPAVPGADFDLCDTDQKLAAPYRTSGFVGGIELNLQSRRFWYLPPIAIAPRFTYAFDTKRFGVEVPLFLLTDSDGKLNSGLKYTCRFRGRTPEGFELKKTCTVNLFVGTSFDLSRTP